VSASLRAELYAANRAQSERCGRYIVRVYVLRALQLLGRAKDGSNNADGEYSVCDPRLTLTCDGTTHNTCVELNKINPKFYQSFDFAQVPFPSSGATLTIQAWDERVGSLSGTRRLIGQTDINLENRFYSSQWQFGTTNGRTRPTERRALYRPLRHASIPQGFVEVCIDILPLADVRLRPLDYLLSPPKREPWDLRVVLYKTRNVKPASVYHTSEADGGECCCWAWCAPPDQSDLMLAAGLMGSRNAPGHTDVHVRCVDGQGLFNWRMTQKIELPAPEQETRLKLQICM
jgi:hypothetical protein